MVAYQTINESQGQSSRDSSEQGMDRRRRSSRSLKDGGFSGQASWLSSNINLVNTSGSPINTAPEHHSDPPVIGAGTLAMSAAMSHMGILLGVIVIVWSALTAGFGLYLQSRCARYLDRGTSSFFALSQITYPNAAVIFDTAIAVKCFGVGVSYLIIIGDLMPGVVRGFNEVAGEVPFLVDRHFWITAFMLVVIPLSFLRRLDSLKYTSVVALVSIGYLVILIIYHFAKGDTMADRGEIRYLKWEGAIATLSSIPVIVFAYTCHQNMFSILNEIKDNSHFRTTTVIGASIGSACSIYVLVAITGYLSFGNKVAGNIVGMYIPSIASTIGKAAIVILVMFSYPLQVHPCRASVDAVLKWRPSKSPTSRDSALGSAARSIPLLSSSAVGQNGRNDSISETRFAAITTAIIVLSYIVAMTVSSLDKVLAYVGSTGSTSISFILPGLFFYKISAPDSIYHQRLLKEDDNEYEQVVEGLFARVTLKDNEWRTPLLRRLALCLAIYGFLVMIVCLIANTFFMGAH